MSAVNVNKSIVNYHRRNTLEVNIGGVMIGGNNEIKVQTMCNVPTSDCVATANQIINVAKNTNCDIIRVTVPALSDVEHLKTIHQIVRQAGVEIPIVADVHFNAAIAFECAKIVEKVRVNPGNFGHHDRACLTQEEYDDEGQLLKDTFREFLKICVEHKTAVRIGTNHGSLAKRILNRYGDTPEGMVESVMEFLRVANEVNFKDIAISLKSSNPIVAIRAARLMVKSMDDENLHYCLHLGVTEAGEGSDGRLKSVSGIAPLVNDGIGDTIRVSLTEAPENEIEPALQIVDYKNYISQAAISPEIPQFYNPYVYNKRETIQVDGIGGNSTSAVALIIDNESELNELLESKLSLKPDVILAETEEIFLKAKSIFRDIKVRLIAELSSNINDVKYIKIDENSNFDLLKSLINNDIVLVAEPISRNKTTATRYIMYQLYERKISNPVLLKVDGGEQDEKFASFAPAAECAGIFTDGFGDGVCFDAKGNVDDVLSLEFKILQINRLRITGVEYVSCPGCGRTMYDLQGTVKRIKAATQNCKNVKIAVMGCIVNGPGEMADADLGYVGAGKGKISLYKSGKVVKRNIPEKDAVDELLKLIETLH